MRDDFPVGETLDGRRWTLVECLAGEAARGYFRARSRDGSTAIVTLAHYQKQPVDLAHYAMKSSRITPLLYVGRLETTLGRYDGLVEAEPAGRPLREHALAADVAVAVIADACTIVDEAHRRGIVLRGLRPELVYVEGGRVTAIAPRCEEFMSTSTPPSSGVLHPFSHYYLAPEILRLRAPSPASDVFSLGAMLAELVSGEHPFRGDNIVEQFHALVDDRRRPWRGPTDLASTIDAALARDPARRPSAAQLARMLQR